MDNLLGVVLCGGESRRMGSDKGLLNTGQGLWALNMRDKLTPWQLPVIYSINERQRETYSLLLPPDRLIIDNALFPELRGPLKGLLSIHEQFPEYDLFLVACDMQDLDAQTIAKVMETYNADRQKPAPHDFFIYRDGTFFQPFCGIYTARGLVAVYHRAGEGRLRDFSLQSLLKAGRTATLPVENSNAFRNYNSL
ncbi:MAG TPA: molybdenum cofactor guanylyltransferase [Puia sp.]